MYNKHIHQFITKIIASVLIFLILPIFLFIKYNLGDLIVSWITLLAIITALFKDQIIELYFTPELTIALSTEPEFLHEVDAKFRIDGLDHVEKQSWLGIKVENLGIAKARNVMVYFDGLGSDVVQNFKNFKTIPLVKAWTNNPLIQLLPRDIGVRFDICCLPKRSPKSITFRFLSTPNELIDIECEPDREHTFEFNIIAVADNAKTKIKKAKIIFQGKYTAGFTAEIK